MFDHTAIGFVGHFDAACFLLKALMDEIPRRRRTDPESLYDWLPILFQHEFEKVVASHKDRTVHFMVASVLKNEPNIVPRKNLADLVDYISSGGSSGKGLRVPPIWAETLEVSRGYEWISIPGTCRNMLYDLASPSFKPRHHSPLQSVAIGTGESVIEEIERCRDVIFAMDQSYKLLYTMFRHIIEVFMAKHRIQSVGGMYPVLKITSRGVGHIGQQIGTLNRATSLDLSFRTGRWVQRNHATGKEIPLLMPWEFLSQKIFKEKTFDDFSDFYDLFLEVKSENRYVLETASDAV